MTLRILKFLPSKIYTLPSQSAVNPIGKLSFADVAFPPSPENPAVPVPANVAILPVPESTFRTFSLAWSAM